jgi:hypothetical protein
MEPSQELIDSIYIEKVLRARSMTPEQKLLDGPRLFAFACEASRAGIRAQHPQATPEQVDELLRERFALLDHLEKMSDG